MKSGGEGVSDGGAAKTQTQVLTFSEAYEAFSMSAMGTMEISDVSSCSSPSSSSLSSSSSPSSSSPPMLVSPSTATASPSLTSFCPSFFTWKLLLSILLPWTWNSSSE